MDDMLKILLLAAEDGDCEAMLSLADMYRYGRDVEKDMALAVKWYEKAADCGIEVAKTILKEIKDS